jgi:DUF218 domain
MTSQWEAVIVPGGGVRADGKLPPWVENRFGRALEIAAGAPIIALSAGTVHRPPPLDAAGRPIFESVAGAAYLRQSGYAPDRILIEAASWDTIGNAYFCRTVHTDPAGFRRLAVVTSAFHMPRTREIFRWVFALPPADAAYHLTFIEVPNVGMPDDVLAARYAKELASRASLPDLMARVRTLRDLHRWLFTEHGAYAAGSGAAPAVDPALAESY